MNGPGRLIGRRRRKAGRDELAGGSRPVEHAPDDLLLAAMSTGDSEAALEFVRRFQRVVYGVAFAGLGDRGLAEDVAQQAFEHAWRQANLYDPRRGTVRAWLIGIARHLAVDTARVRRPTPVNPPELTNLVKAIADSAEHQVMIGETAAELAEALAELPAEQARAAVMAAAHGFTAREIAQTEGIPVATAKSRVRLALDKLNAALPARGDHE
jgi:RNA polymerase sigma factor (sigma-70 family)